MSKRKVSEGRGIGTGRRVKDRRVVGAVVRKESRVPVGTRSVFVYKYTGYEWNLVYDEQVLPNSGHRVITIHDDMTMHIA